jgi:glycosyltransferase involved in cell wall biosynthesis
MQSTKRQTIVFVESAAAMGGVQFSTLYLVQTLDPERWRCVVVCPEEGDLVQACREARIETHVLSQPRLWSTSVRIGATRLPNPLAWAGDFWLLARAVARLRAFLKQLGPDLIITKGLPSHFLGGFAARKLRTPCVWHVQDLISERSFGIYRRALGWAARALPTRIIVDGQSIAEQLPPSLRSRTDVIYNGVDTNVFSPEVDGTSARREFGIGGDELVIGHAGRVTPWKGQHYLIEAFAEVAKSNPKVTLLLVGAPVFDNDSYQRRLVTTVAQLGLGKRVKFAGYRQDLPALLAAMDVFAFTSIEKDTSPLALLSAMSTGLPIVAFDIDGARELMASADQFLLTPVKNVTALAGALLRVVEDASLRQALGDAARKQALSEFSLERYRNRIEHVFTETLAGRAADRLMSAPEVHAAASDLHI